MGERLRLWAGPTTCVDVLFHGSEITPKRLRNLCAGLELQARILEEDDLTPEVFNAYAARLSHPEDTP